MQTRCHTVMLAAGLLLLPASQGRRVFDVFYI